jgi:hypothetical protein
MSPCRCLKAVVRFAKVKTDPIERRSIRLRVLRPHAAFEEIHVVGTLA